MIIGAQNLLTINFCSDLVCKKTLKAQPHAQEFLNFNIIIAIKSEQKIIRK